MEPLLKSKDLPPIVSRFVVSRAPAMTQPSFCRLVRTCPRAEEEFGTCLAKNQLKLPKIWPETWSSLDNGAAPQIQRSTTDCLSLRRF